MHILLWVLQILTALLYGASGVMKTFLFEKVSKDVPSFRAMPRGAWLALGVMEMVCAVALIVPAALRWHPEITAYAAALLAVESLIFVWVHLRYTERTPIVMSAVLGVVMAFVAYGRLVLRPIG